MRSTLLTITPSRPLGWCLWPSRRAMNPRHRVCRQTQPEVCLLFDRPPTHPSFSLTATEVLGGAAINAVPFLAFGANIGECAANIDPQDILTGTLRRSRFCRPVPGFQYWWAGVFLGQTLTVCDLPGRILCEVDIQITSQCIGHHKRRRGQMSWCTHSAKCGLRNCGLPVERRYPPNRLRRSHTGLLAGSGHNCRYRSCSHSQQG